ncbi:pilus assembly protein [Rhodococcus hoagii]|uniref:TadE/TadG family type IV pilus assembly protein n=1 Tax=Rhodococcus hoagii TaxID=43767 RepID=UPI0007CD54AB|nr:TadE/TadG family type IV pilus assembly protein [Prescottella equi]MCD7052343.1 pilus assembly protein [Rhodococcus sp. BH2-1]MBM4519664.1 pilus assembly protein [Prescottella equi]MBM4529016.1 pilus assembly protein [Prescottella equi]MBM4536313.1 pilus assembly protein [Prescottella equi]MBM4545286.1 pilus assembly protein [Prescottella equi]
MGRFRSESGAAAVEFALVVPILILLVLGIIEFGRAYNIQNSLSAAAREGVRVMAISKNATAAKAATKQAGLFNPAVTDAQICISTGASGSCTATTCPAGGTVTLTIRYPVEYVTGLFPGSLTLTGKGVMRCGG